MPAVHSDGSGSAQDAFAAWHRTVGRRPDAGQQAHHTSGSDDLAHEQTHADQAAQVQGPPRYGAAASRPAAAYLLDIRASVLTSRNPCLEDTALHCPLLTDEAAPVNCFGA